MDASILQDGNNSNPSSRKTSNSFVSLEPGGNDLASRWSSSGEIASGRPCRAATAFGVSGGQAPHQPPPAVTFCSNGGKGGFGPGHPANRAPNTTIPITIIPAEISPTVR